MAERKVKGVTHIGEQRIITLLPAQQIVSQPDSFSLSLCHPSINLTSSCSKVKIKIEIPIRKKDISNLTSDRKATCTDLHRRQVNLAT